MRHAPSGPGGSFQDRSCRALSLAALLCGTAIANLCAAQDLPIASRPGRASVLAAGDEDSLWLCQIGEARSQVFLRGLSPEFSLGDVIFGRIEAAFPIRDELLLVLPDGSLYRHDGKRAVAERNLPNQGRPIDVVADDASLYALVRSRDAEALPPRAAEPTTHPTEVNSEGPRFDAGSAPLSLLQFTPPTLWFPVAPCPPAVDGSDRGPLRPRLLRFGSSLYLFAIEPSEERVRAWSFDLPSSTWTEEGPIGFGGRAAGFWVTLVSDVPTLIASLHGGPTLELVALRRLGSGPDRRGEWQSSELSLSEPIETLQGADAAFGFNQHVAILTYVAGKPFVVFGFFGGPPLEKTIATQSVFERPVLVTNVHSLLQLITMVILIVMLIGMWTFRRSSLLEAAPLPEQWETAGSFQRAAAFLIDFAIFSLPAANVLGLSWFDAVGSLASWGWAFTPESRAAGSLPDLTVLGWWGLSCGGLTLYAFIMELITGRTIGKVLMGIRVVTEKGERPALLQIFVRNVLRPVELWPQFWVLTVLVILSRNQQRLGDVFALTLVVRPAPRRISHSTRREGDSDETTPRDDASTPRDSNDRSDEETDRNSSSNEK